MRLARSISIAVALCVAFSPAHAAEAPSVAGPIGGTDVRSALPVPPGFYAGIAVLRAETTGFLDADGRTVPGLSNAKLKKTITGPFFYYVPDVKVLGGSIGVGGYVPVIDQGGHLFMGQGDQHNFAVGDPYVELDWSRYFGTPRASRYPNAYPILEGLSVLAGVGIVVPIGEYFASDPLTRAISASGNVWDVAPTIGFTYTTPPILAEGTEISMRLFWNNYRDNPETRYLMGDIINIDFAVTERIGPLQIGVAGFFATQIEDDKLFGLRAPPDGRQAEVLGLGGVAVYDLPQYATSLKLKAMTTAPHVENTVESWMAIVSMFKKF